MSLIWPILFLDMGCLLWVQNMINVPPFFMFFVGSTGLQHVQRCAYWMGPLLGLQLQAWSPVMYYSLSTSFEDWVALILLKDRVLSTWIIVPMLATRVSSNVPQPTHKVNISSRKPDWWFNGEKNKIKKNMKFDICHHFMTWIHSSHQSGTKPNLVAKILATNFGVFL